jgi:hypothetical protein
MAITIKTDKRANGSIQPQISSSKVLSNHEHCSTDEIPQTPSITHCNINHLLSILNAILPA